MSENVVTIYQIKNGPLTPIIKVWDPHHNKSYVNFNVLFEIVTWKERRVVGMGVLYALHESYYEVKVLLP